MLRNGFTDGGHEGNRGTGRTFTVLIQQQANTTNPVTLRAEDEKVQGNRSWDR